MAFCAKGGHPMDWGHPIFVCREHYDTEGLYTHCRNCGGELPGESRKFTHQGWGMRCSLVSTPA